MGLLGKIKKKKDSDENSDNAQPGSEVANDDIDSILDDESTLELDDNPVDQDMEFNLELETDGENEGESEEKQEEEDKKDDDDILGSELMDIFEDDDVGGLDLDALTEYLEDVDMDSLLAQARHVSNRIRGLDA